MKSILLRLLVLLVVAFLMFGVLPAFAGADQVNENGVPLVIDSPSGEGDLIAQEDDPPIITLPDEPFYAEVELWAKAALLAAAVLAIEVTAAVSTLKTILWSFVNDEVEFDLKKTHLGNVAVYPILIMFVTFLASYIVIAQQFDFNPWAEAPFAGLATADELVQNLMSAALVTFFAVTEHEGLTRWLMNK